MKVIFQKFIDQFRPKFLEKRVQKSHYEGLFNYRRFWLLSIALRAFTSLVPLGIFLLLTYNQAYKAIQTENNLRTLRLTSNTRRTVAFFLEERLDTLRFIIQEEKFKNLNSTGGLSDILNNLKMGFGGFLDIGLIDKSGVQIKYVGPFDLEGKDYREQEWFIRCVANGVYVSEVFLGYRKVPHLIIAVKLMLKNGAFYILKATLDFQKFTEILSTLDLSAESDLFICNREGRLQTPSKYYGKLFERMEFPIPEYSVHSMVIETKDRLGNTVLIGYAYIENSPFILMLVKRTEVIMKGWYSLRKKFLLLFLGSAIVILIIILGISTYMVNKIHDAEQKRTQVLERVESTSRLASIGRLAAGVAHEINNPLAIINENTGLIKDLFTLKREYKGDQRLMELIDDVLESVERCGEITKNLLGFAKQIGHKVEPLQLNAVIAEVLTFLRKEALYRNITLNIDVSEDIPKIHSDHGKLQQIFLNLINNALQSMDDGGKLDIAISKPQGEHVSIVIKDNGCGIPDEVQNKIFEPFFSTKTDKGGTGLGLAITYGLVKSLHGDISMKSKVGEGTSFVITLPVKPEEEIKHESPAG
ncbi:ATP-binding protein [Thermodesulfobacteriota bacterium]